MRQASVAWARPDCLFFCRGRGRGHAVPDLEIVKNLRQRKGARQTVQFVSYSTGAETLAQGGEDIFELGLPDRNPFVETLVLCAQLIGSVQPKLVVSHEEFAALPAAKIFGIPTVFLTDWFVEDPDRPIMRSLQFADEIVFLEREGCFTPPAYIKDKVRYVGPIVRPLAYSRDDRARVREKLRLPADATVLAVIPGAWATEDRAPLWDLLVAAFDALDAPGKHLVWNAGVDATELTHMAGGRDDITVLQHCDPIERLMAGCDLGITKGNRGSTLDMHYMGVPSVSISFRANPIDDRMVPRIPSNTALYIDQLAPDSLAAALKLALSAEKPEKPNAPELDAIEAAADRIAHHLEAAGLECSRTAADAVGSGTVEGVGPGSSPAGPTENNRLPGSGG